jgi:hypothetical protein
MIVIITVGNKQQPLAFGDHCCQLWQWRWQLSTAAITVVVDINDRTTAGADKYGRRRTQQARGDRRHHNQPTTGASEG